MRVESTNTYTETEEEDFMGSVLRERPLARIFLEKVLLQGRCSLKLLPPFAIKGLATQICLTHGLREFYCQNSKKDRL